MKDVIFSNAIARYNETRLLKKEQLTRLVSALDYNEALKMLYDYGYIRPKEGAGIEEVIAAQTDALNKYAKEECPSPHLLKILLNPDYYNFAKLDYKNQILNGGQVSIDESMPKPMKECISVLNALKQESAVDGRIIDIKFTEAMFSDSLSSAKKSLRKEVRAFITAQIDMNNFLTFTRCRNLKRDWDFCKAMLIKGGKIDLDHFEKFYQVDEKDIAEDFPKYGYGEIIEKIIEGKINPDLGIDAVLIDKAMINSLSYTSLSPFLSYYYKQLTEYRAIKMVLTLLKNNCRDEIAKRIKVLYD